MAHCDRRQIKSNGIFIVGALLLVAFVSWTVAVAQTSSFVNVAGTTWATRFDGTAHNTERQPVMTLDDHSNVYVAADTRSLTDNPSFVSTPDMDIVTIKYDSAGHQQWADTFDGEGNFLDHPNAIRVDSAGNVFVTGYSWRGRNDEGGSGYDFVTIKYDAAGNRQWVRYYTGPQQPSQTDQAYFIELDGAGNAYVTGMSFYTGRDDRLFGEIVTLKYDTFGNEIWIRSYTGVDRAGSMPQALSVDQSGNVYVAGMVNRYKPASNTVDSDHVLLKYGANGDLVFAAQHDSPGSVENDDDYVDYMHLDSSGNVYLVGRTRPMQDYPDNDTGIDLVLLKFTPTGSLAWERNWTTPGDDEFRTFEEIPDELVTDSAGNVYVSGHTDDRNLFWAIIAIKFDANGNELWHDIYDPGPGDADWPAGIEIAPDGQKIYVGATARNEQDQSQYDVTIIQYSQDGARTINRYDASPAAEVFGPIGENRNVMDIDSGGNLFLVAQVQDEGKRPDLLIERIGTVVTPTPTPTPTATPTPTPTPTPSPKPNGKPRVRRMFASGIHSIEPSAADNVLGDIGNFTHEIKKNPIFLQPVIAPIMLIRLTGQETSTEEADQALGTKTKVHDQSSRSALPTINGFERVRRRKRTLRKTKLILN